MIAPLISLRGITKTFGEGSAAFQALRGINLDIQPGDFVAVMGPSAASMFPPAEFTCSRAIMWSN
jgi:putative ABC transport system ATP-binding protein